jgi:Ca2+:H+ antiporter
MIIGHEKLVLMLHYLSVYGGYLVFQLWSHTHYYEDSKTTSDKLSKTIKNRVAEKSPGTADIQTNNFRKSPYMNPSATSSDITLGYPDMNSTSPKLYQPLFSPEWLTFKPVGDARPRDYGMHHYRSGSVVSDGSAAIFRDSNAEGRQHVLREPTETFLAGSKDQALQPQLSWTMTLLLLTAVTIVSF